MTSRSSRVEEESRGGSGSGSGEEARGEKGITPRARCINNDQRERERGETQHRSHGCLLGPSGTDPPYGLRTYFCLPPVL